MTACFLVFLSMLYEISCSESVSATWLLNTFDGNPDWVETFINDMWVSPDGTVYTTCIWDENGRPGSIWKDGKFMGLLQFNANQFGGLAVTGYYDNNLNENVIFAGNGGGSTPASKIFKFHQDGSSFNFDGSNSNTFNPTTSTQNTTVYGLAANSKYLIVSDPNNNRIVIYDSNTGKLQTQFAFQRPSDIAIDSNQNLWIIQASFSFGGYPINVPNKYYGPSTIQKWSISGQYLGVNITDLVEPASVDIQILKNGVERLLITDFGPTQQVSAYIGLNASTVHLDYTFYNNGTFGYSAYNNGSDSGDMTISPQSLYRLAAAGGDSNGNLYVNCGGPYPRGDYESGTDLRSFNANSDINWWIYGKAFVIMGDVDPLDPTMFYTGYDAWKYDTNVNQWIFQAITHNRFKYPQDSRVIQ
eukprot:129827_1